MMSLPSGAHMPRNTERNKLNYLWTGMHSSSNSLRKYWGTNMINYHWLLTKQQRRLIAPLAFGCEKWCHWMLLALLFSILLSLSPKHSTLSLKDTLFIEFQSNLSFADSTKRRISKIEWRPIFGKTRLSQKRQNWLWLKRNASLELPRLKGTDDDIQIYREWMAKQKGITPFPQAALFESPHYPCFQLC